MIQSKEELKFYLDEDKKALGRTGRHPHFF